MDDRRLEVGTRHADATRRRCWPRLDRQPNSPLPDPSGRGAAAVKFLNLLQLNEGKFAGQRNRLQPWQARLVTRIYGDVSESGRRRINTVIARSREGTAKRFSAVRPRCCICNCAPLVQPADTSVLSHMLVTDDLGPFQCRSRS